MKTIFTLFTFLLLQAAPMMAQYGYFPNFFGDLYYRSLEDPETAVLVGTTMNQIGASDFDLDGTYYAISGVDNSLYVIDTTDGSYDLVGAVTNTGSAFWTGMACDPTDGTMYVCSTDGSTSSFYTINLADATTTLIGTNTAESGVTGIAFDDSGQMYAIYLVRKFYKIDKSDATATFVGNLYAAVSVLTHHGLDFDSQTQTMYLVSYNTFNFDNELWTVDLETGVNTLVGSVDIWTGTMAVEPSPEAVAAFSADTTETCAGGEISFTDESAGNPDSWLWTFEGGTPATSTEQNPVVTYEGEGTFDVSLEVTYGTSADTLHAEDFIIVFPIPEPLITGDAVVCAGDVRDYATNDNSGSTYSWEVEGGTVISGSSTHQVTVEWGDPGTGLLTVTEDNGECAATTGPFEVAISEVPAPEISGLAVVCEGDITEYSTADNAGSSYTWEVEGGTVIAGSGTHEITVEWGDPGTGQVTVLEDNSDCTGMDGPFVVVIEECTSTGETVASQMSVHPNPVKESITILFNGFSRGMVRILDGTGRVLLIEPYECGGLDSKVIHVHSLPKGIYFLQAGNDTGFTLTTKFIKTE